MRIYVAMVIIWIGGYVTSMGIGKINVSLNIGDCFEIPTVPATIFKVRSKFKHSYYAGRYSGDSTGRKFYPKYPAMQISMVPFSQPIWQTDCMKAEGWKEKWEEAIINEYNDRKDKYDKDAVVPKKGG